MAKYKRVFNFKELWRIVIPIVIILFFWNTWFMTAFKMLVVLLHEYSHGIAAMATGGSIASITIDRYQGGSTFTSGGNAILVASAGYIGSLLFGLLFLALSKVKGLAKYFVILLGLLILAMTVLYVRTPFAIIYSMVITLLLGIIGIFGGKTVNEYILKFLGALTALYVLYDIKSDLFFNKSQNDATILASVTGIPAIFWSVVWSAITLIVLYYFFFTKKEEKIEIE